MHLSPKKVFRKKNGIPFEKMLTYLWNKILIMFEAYVPGQASGMDENFTTLLALVGDLVVLLLIVPRQVSLGCKHITTILNISKFVIVKQEWKLRGLNFLCHRGMPNKNKIGYK